MPTVAPATAELFDGKTATGLTGSVRISGTDLHFLADDGGHCVVWALATLQPTDRDAPGDAATFRTRSGPERLTISDPAVLAQLQHRGMWTARSWTARSWAVLTAAILASLGVAALVVAQLPSLLLPLVPHGAERAWSNATEAAVTLGQRRCDAPAGTAQLTTLMDRLAKAAGVQPAPPFSVVDSPLVNAFTLPDGRIVILRGLLDRAEDGDELAGVLAHEIGHVRERDPTREMLRGLMLNMLARSLGWSGNFAGQMTALSFGRRAEQRADASALQTLRVANLHADGLSRFFVMLQGFRKDDGLPAFLSDHPTSASRAETLRVKREGRRLSPAPRGLPFGRSAAESEGECCSCKQAAVFEQKNQKNFCSRGRALQKPPRQQEQKLFASFSRKRSACFLTPPCEFSPLPELHASPPSAPHQHPASPCQPG